MKKILMLFILSIALSLYTFSQSESTIDYNIEITEGKEILIETDEQQVAFVEVYKNFPDMILIETIDFTNIDHKKLSNLDKAIYVFAFKSSNGKVLALKSLELE